MRFAHVIDPDHVVAELGLHRRSGGLALVQFGHGFRELRHVAAGIGPVQIAAVGARARVLGLLLGDFVELAALVQAGNDRLGLFFLFHKDMACLVFLAAVGGLELVVLGLDLGVGDRIGFLVIGKQLADQQGLARQLHLALEVIRRVQAALLRFLHEDFACDHFVLDLPFHLRRDRAARFGNLRRQRVGAGLRDGLAVDDGEVLRGRRQGDGEHGCGES